ncbi:hypothetical protein PtA15_3A544 [Puccinia triticina]|uniref:Uncharacterized protein n=1 Tax=Puccinia triticina TaxID=208348 RepID=A0ABY7CEH8_9BASI|nr:uncharacterized protein PtA15_3A544 [Puccinia triticina]WAQ83175.1 hypothetical protein PtA15_3A544 [Puccinia triticina]
MVLRSMQSVIWQLNVCIENFHALGPRRSGTGRSSTPAVTSGSKPKKTTSSNKTPSKKSSKLAPKAKSPPTPPKPKPRKSTVPKRKASARILDSNDEQESGVGEVAQSNAVSIDSESETSNSSVAVPVTRKPTVQLGPTRRHVRSIAPTVPPNRLPSQAAPAVSFVNPNPNVINNPRSATAPTSRLIHPFPSSAAHPCQPLHDHSINRTKGRDISQTKRPAVPPTSFHDLKVHSGPGSHNPKAHLSPSSHNPKVHSAPGLPAVYLSKNTQRPGPSKTDSAPPNSCTKSNSNPIQSLSINECRRLSRLVNHRLQFLQSEHRTRLEELRPSKLQSSTFRMPPAESKTEPCWYTAFSQHAKQEEQRTIHSLIPFRLSSWWLPVTDAEVPKPQYYGYELESTMPHEPSLLEAIN